MRVARATSETATPMRIRKSMTCTTSPRRLMTPSTHFGVRGIGVIGRMRTISRTRSTGIA